jgi:hypothetical protein
MPSTRLQSLALAVAGVSALGVGAAIVLAPHAFYAGYGVAIGSDPSLLSELRAPGAGLVAFGAVMLAGALRRAMREAATVAALCVFLGFPAGRLVGLAVDGVPSTGILAALIFELAVAALCLLVVAPRAWRAEALQARGRAV